VRIVEGLIEFTAIFLIIFSPIAFGATERWSKLVVEAAACSMCALWCFRAVIRHKFSFAKSPLNLLVVAFIMLACFQLAPLPGFLASRFSPTTVHIETGTLPGANTSPIEGAEAKATAMTAQAASARRISANPASGRSFLYLIAAYAIAFLVIMNTYRRREQISRLLAAVVVVGFTVAMLGILGRVAPNGKVLWLRDAPSGAIWFGPFVNRNHFAGYLVMVVPVALGMMIGASNRDKKTLLGFAAAVMTGAVFLSASRGGVLSLAVAATVFCLMLISSRNAKKNLFPLVLVACIALIGAVVIGIGPLLSRSAGLASMDSAGEYRWDVWKDTARMAGAFPLFGVGLGCFRHVFPIYKTLSAQLLFTHAENEYLQLLAEAGIGGLAIGAIFIALILKNSLRSFKGKRSSFSSGLMIGLTAAAVGMLAHSFVDFNLHVPANGLLFAMILGLLVVFGSVHVSCSSQTARTSWVELPSHRLLKGETVVAHGIMGTFCVSLATVCLLAFLVASSAGSFLAERQLDSVERQALQFVKGKRNLNVADNIRAVQAAVTQDSDNAQWHFKAGLFYQTLGQIKLRAAEGALGRSGAEYLYKLAVNELKKATTLDRFNGRYRAALAIAYGECERYDEAHAAFRAAVGMDPTNAWIHRKYGKLTWNTDRAAAQAAFRRALELDPHYTRDVLTKLSSQTVEMEDLRQCIPDNSETVFEYAAFLINNKYPDEAEKVLLALLPQVETKRSKRHLAAKVFFRLGQIRQSNGFGQDAVTCFLKATSLQPDKHAYYEELGYACLRQKRYNEARRFLEQRLRMGPAKDGRVFLALAEVFENVGPADTAHRYYRRALQSLPTSWNVSRNEALRGLERTTDQ